MQNHGHGNNRNITDTSIDDTNRRRDDNMDGNNTSKSSNNNDAINTRNENLRDRDDSTRPGDGIARERENRNKEMDNIIGNGQGIDDCEVNRLRNGINRDREDINKVREDITRDRKGIEKDREETKALSTTLKAREKQLNSLDLVLQAREKELDKRYSQYETAQACLAGYERKINELEETNLILKQRLDSQPTVQQPPIGPNITQSTHYRSAEQHRSPPLESISQRIGEMEFRLQANQTQQLTNLLLSQLLVRDKPISHNCCKEQTIPKYANDNSKGEQRSSHHHYLPSDRGYRRPRRSRSRSPEVRRRHRESSPSPSHSHHRYRKHYSPVRRSRQRDSSPRSRYRAHFTSSPPYQANVTSSSTELPRGKVASSSQEKTEQVQYNTHPHEGHVYRHPHHHSRSPNNTQGRHLYRHPQHHAKAPDKASKTWHRPEGPRQEKTHGKNINREARQKVDTLLTNNGIISNKDRTSDLELLLPDQVPEEDRLLRQLIEIIDEDSDNGRSK
jgi:hypothetical protein